MLEVKLRKGMTKNQLGTAWSIVRGLAVFVQYRTLYFRWSGSQPPLLLSLRKQDILFGGFNTYLVNFCSYIPKNTMASVSMPMFLSPKHFPDPFPCPVRRSFEAPCANPLRSFPAHLPDGMSCTWARASKKIVPPKDQMFSFLFLQAMGSLIVYCALLSF